MKKLSAKTEKFSESRIREMTILANQYGAINLAQGYPEFDPPKTLTDALKKVSQEGPHQYAPNWGADNLRQVIAEKQSKALGRSINPKKEILVTCGATEAMISVVMAMFDPGDKVIIFSPYYNSYLANTMISDTEPIFVSLYPPDFSFNKEELENAFRQNPKALILCNPSNPSGKVFTLEELQIIADLAKKYDTYVITDEVYEHMVFEPHHYTYFGALPEMFERTISCSSLSKSYSVTGWRLGYVTAPNSILEQVRKFHDFFTVCAPAPLQEAAVTALKYSDGYYSELIHLYEHKKKILLDGLDAAGIRHTNPQGTYFVLADISEFGFSSDEAFCRMLVKDYGIAAVPGSCFFHEDEQRYIRLHFAKNDETLYTVAQRFQKLKRDFQKKIDIYQSARIV